MTKYIERNEIFKHELDSDLSEALTNIWVRYLL